MLDKILIGKKGTDVDPGYVCLPYIPIVPALVNCSGLYSGKSINSKYYSTILIFNDRIKENRKRRIEKLFEEKSPTM